MDSAEIKHDSASNQLFNYIKKSGANEQRKNLLEYSEDTIATKQDATIELIKKLTLEAQNYLENGLDTTGLTDELDQIKNWYQITGDGIFTNIGTMQTHRNLETSYKIMRELLIRVEARKLSLDLYYKKLVGYRNTIDSLYQQDVLYQFSSDSATLMRYAERLTVVSQEIKPIDSSLKRMLLDVSDLQPAINILVNKLASGIEQIEIFQRDLSTKTFNRETNNLGGVVKYNRPFNEIVYYAKTKAALSFVFYVQNETGKLALLFLLVIACTIFLVNLKRNIRKQNLLNKDNQEQSVLKYPFLSALVIVLNIFQFIFIDPPFVFAALIWIVSGLSLIFILKNVVSRYWLLAWLILFVLFLFACVDTLILQATRPERWMMIGLSVVGILSGAAIIWSRHRAELKEKLLIYFIGFGTIMQMASILANVYGRYNVSKTCLIAGFFNVVLVILFYWTLRLVGQGFALTARVYNKPNRKLFNINFERTGKTPVGFYVLLFTGWFILLARNFYEFNYISVPIKDFIAQKRTIGEFSFTIGSIFEFFLILYLSGVISRMVSFFAAGNTSEPAVGRRSGIGSWVLIIRISIVTIGLLAAFAAVGIPMDRLTIILSALSVGVGFGLQSLVNNLVSGLIISFEKPVNVGDIVEIGEQKGVVKSIGFRSSIITTGAGANVVIPNGDLLNQHLVNWTHENASISVDINVGVAYGTDLVQVIKILQELPQKDERILRDPAPNVVIRQFNSSSIDMQLSFWLKNIRDQAAVKSDILLAIDLAFKENAIKIPVPRQELHISSFTKEEVAGKNEDEQT